MVLSAAPSGLPIKVRRVREVRFPRPDLAIEALVRGDVSMLEHVPPNRVVELSKSPDLKVGAFATPSVHRIALDGRTPAIRNRKLRRALSMAIDRSGLLEDVVLGHPKDDLNRVSDGPFVRGSFVDATDVAPLDYNPLLARGLVAAAKRELGKTVIQADLRVPGDRRGPRRRPEDGRGVRPDRRRHRADRAARVRARGRPPVGPTVRPGLPSIPADAAAPRRRPAPGPGLRRGGPGRCAGVGGEPPDLATAPAPRPGAGDDLGPDDGDPGRPRVARRAAGHPRSGRSRTTSPGDRASRDLARRSTRCIKASADGRSNRG